MTYYYGTLLAAEPWTIGGPFACSTPQHATRLSYATGTGASMVVNNACIGDPFATNDCAALPNSNVVISQISALGTPSVSTNDLPNVSFGYYVLGMAQGFTMNPGGSAGNLCMTG